MCMACEEAQMFYRWNSAWSRLPKGEMPKGMTEEDLRAMELPVPGEVEIVEEADGSMVIKRVAQPKPAKELAPKANAFVCDTDRTTGMTESDLPVARAGTRPAAGEKAFCHRIDGRAYRRNRTRASLNAYVLETPDKARAMAKASGCAACQTARAASARKASRLGIKDLFCTTDVRTTACSKILGKFCPDLRVDRVVEPVGAMAR